MYKLNSVQGDLIANLEVNASRPLKDLVKPLGVKEKTLYYHLRQLSEAEVIVKTAFINIYKANLRYVNIYFSVRSASAESLQELEKFILKCSDVYWFGELGGTFHYGIALGVRAPEEVSEFLANLPPKISNLMSDRTVLFHTKLNVFSKKYLSKKIISYDSLQYGGLIENHISLDSIDLRILDAMSNQKITAGRAVSRHLGLPHTTIDLRIKKLEKTGVISGYWYRCDSRKFGYQIFKLLVSTQGATASIRKEITNYCQKEANFTLLIECLGAWDTEISLEVERGEDVAAFQRKFMQRFEANIVDIKVIPVFRVIKFSQLPSAHKFNL